jgi:hypothetical protein
VVVFSLGDSSDAFLLLRAHDLGMTDALLPTLWAAFHVSKLLSSYFGVSYADRVLRTRLIMAGWAVYAAVYLGLGLAHGPAAAWVLFVVYGTYYGLSGTGTTGTSPWLNVRDHDQQWEDRRPEPHR